jgi:hypothetical protein
VENRLTMCSSRSHSLTGTRKMRRAP